MCGQLSCWAWCALLFITVGSILDSVGVFTNSWMYYSGSGVTNRIGLWRTQSCSSTTCAEGVTPDSFKDDLFRATQAMEVIAFIFFIVACTGVSLFVCCLSLRSRRKACFFMTLCFICALFVCIGMILWLVYIFSPYYVGYSFGLTCLAGIFAVIAGLCLIPEIENDDEYDFDDYDKSGRNSPGRNSISPVYSRKNQLAPPSPRYAHTPAVLSSSRALSPVDTRHVNPIYKTPTPPPSRELVRQPISSTPAPVTYNSMPAPMTPDLNQAGPLSRTSNNDFGTATFNDVSNITLQRDKAMY